MHELYEEYTNEYNLKIKEETKIIRKNSRKLKKYKKGKFF